MASVNKKTTCSRTIHCARLILQETKRNELCSYEVGIVIKRAVTPSNPCYATYYPHCYTIAHGRGYLHPGGRHAASCRSQSENLQCYLCQQQEDHFQHLHPWYTSDCRHCRTIDHGCGYLHPGSRH